jgi:hypothetical protein
MVLVDFYKVIEVIKRKLTHVRLAKLEKRAVKGDLSQGEVIPTQTTVKNYLVDGKRFRVGVRWAKDVVCQVDDHACYYWNGEPQRLDTMD